MPKYAKIRKISMDDNLRVMVDHPMSCILWALFYTEYIFTPLDVEMCSMTMNTTNGGLICKGDKKPLVLSILFINLPN